MTTSLHHKVENWLRSKNIKVPFEWVQQCVDFLLNECQAHAENDQLYEQVLEQWLISDLSVLDQPVLASALTDKLFIGTCALQINYAVDVSQSMYSQLKRILGSENSNADVDADQDPQAKWEPKPSRVLLVELTDGVTKVKAMEYEPLPFPTAQFAPGCKVVLNGPLPYNKSYILLRRGCMQMLGGHVEDLVTSFQQKVVLQKCLELQRATASTGSSCRQVFPHPGKISSKGNQVGGFMALKNIKKHEPSDWDDDDDLPNDDWETAQYFARKPTSTDNSDKVSLRSPHSRNGALAEHKQQPYQRELKPVSANGYDSQYSLPVLPSEDRLSSLLVGSKSQHLRGVASPKGVGFGYHSTCKRRQFSEPPTGASRAQVVEDNSVDNEQLFDSIIDDEFMTDGPLTRPRNASGCQGTSTISNIGSASKEHHLPKAETLALDDSWSADEIDYHGEHDDNVYLAPAEPPMEPQAMAVKTDEVIDLISSDDDSSSHGLVSLSSNSSIDITKDSCRSVATTLTKTAFIAGRPTSKWSHPIPTPSQNANIITAHANPLPAPISPSLVSCMDESQNVGNMNVSVSQILTNFKPCSDEHRSIFSHLCYASERQQGDTFTVKAHISTVLSPLSTASGEWVLRVRINDGSAVLDCNLSNAVIEEHLGCVKDLKEQRQTLVGKKLCNQLVKNFQRWLPQVNAMIKIRIKDSSDSEIISVKAPTIDDVNELKKCLLGR